MPETIHEYGEPVHNSANHGIHARYHYTVEPAFGDKVRALTLHDRTGVDPDRMIAHWGSDTSGFHSAIPMTIDPEKCGDRNVGRKAVYVHNPNGSRKTAYALEGVIEGTATNYGPKDIMGFVAKNVTAGTLSAEEAAGILHGAAEHLTRHAETSMDKALKKLHDEGAFELRRFAKSCLECVDKEPEVLAKMANQVLGHIR